MSKVVSDVCCVFAFTVVDFYCKEVASDIRGPPLTWDDC
jgi:hypothetical protein